MAVQFWIFPIFAEEIKSCERDCADWIFVVLRMVEHDRWSRGEVKVIENTVDFVVATPEQDVVQADVAVEDIGVFDEPFMA